MKSNIKNTQSSPDTVVEKPSPVLTLKYTGNHPTNFILEDGKEVVLHKDDCVEYIKHPVIDGLKISGLLVETSNTKN